MLPCTDSTTSSCAPAGTANTARPITLKAAAANHPPPRCPDPPGRHRRLLCSMRGRDPRAPLDDSMLGRARGRSKPGFGRFSDAPAGAGTPPPVRWGRDTTGPGAPCARRSASQQERRLHAIRDAEALVDQPDVELDGVRRDVQALGDATVVEAGREQLEHVALAVREPPGDRLAVRAVRGVRATRPGRRPLRRRRAGGSATRSWTHESPSTTPSTSWATASRRPATELSSSMQHDDRHVGRDVAQRRRRSRAERRDRARQCTSARSGGRARTARTSLHAVVAAQRTSNPARSSSRLTASSCSAGR